MIRNDEAGVGQIDLSVPVDVAEGDIPVGNGKGGVLAVRGDQQGVGEVDLAVAVDVSQQAACGHLSARQAGQRFHPDFDRTVPHPEGRVDVGDESRTRDRQPVDLPLVAGRDPRP